MTEPLRTTEAPPVEHIPDALPRATSRSMHSASSRAAPEDQGRDATHHRAHAIPWGWIALVSCTLIVAVTIVLVVQSIRGAVPIASSTRTVVRQGPNVLVAVRSLARLETVNFHMERVIELTDEQSHLFGLVGANDRILLVAAGDVSAGVDLAKVRSQDVRTDWEHRSVTMVLPAVELFHAALDNARTRTYRRDTDTLAVRSDDLETRARQEAERAMRDAALQSGVLTRGRDNAERAVRAMLTSLGFEQVELRWREDSAALRPAN